MGITTLRVTSNSTAAHGDRTSRQRSVAFWQPERESALPCAGGSRRSIAASTTRSGFHADCSRRSASCLAPEAFFYHIVLTIYHETGMGAQLNIKREDAKRLASRLSELTGESLTTAVTEALRERLDRQLQVRDRDAR